MYSHDSQQTLFLAKPIVVLRIVNTTKDSIKVGPQDFLFLQW